MQAALHFRRRRACADCAQKVGFGPEPAAVYLQEPPAPGMLLGVRHAPRRPRLLVPRFVSSLAINGTACALMDGPRKRRPSVLVQHGVPELPPADNKKRKLLHAGRSKKLLRFDRVESDLPRKQLPDDAGVPHKNQRGDADGAHMPLRVEGETRKSLIVLLKLSEKVKAGQIGEQVLFTS